MCQQWINIVGLLLDAIGVSMIVWEWHVMFQRGVADKVGQIDALYARLSRKMEGLPPETEEEIMGEEHWSMGKHMHMGMMEDVRYRGKFVYGGLAFILIGFFFQVIGSIPGGLWAMKSCSVFGFGP